MNRQALLERCVTETGNVAAGLALARQCVEFIDEAFSPPVRVTPSAALMAEPATMKSRSAPPARVHASKAPVAAEEPEGRVLATIVAAGPGGIARGEVVKRTGLSLNVVVHRIERLVAKRLVRREGQARESRIVPVSDGPNLAADDKQPRPAPALPKYARAARDQTRAAAAPHEVPSGPAGKPFADDLAACEREWNSAMRGVGRQFESITPRRA